MTPNYGSTDIPLNCGNLDLRLTFAHEQSSCCSFYLASVQLSHYPEEEGKKREEEEEKEEVEEGEKT